MQILLREYGALQQKSAAVGLFLINFRCYSVSLDMIEHKFGENKPVKDTFPHL